MGEPTGILVRRFDHFELQHGKDICDRICVQWKLPWELFATTVMISLQPMMCTWHWKNGRWKGQLQPYALLMNHTRTIKIKKLEGFSKFHNFSSEFEGICVWQCYGIGSKKFVPYKSLIVQPQKSPSLITKEPFFPISVSRVLKPEKKGSLDSICEILLTLKFI